MYLFVQIDAELNNFRWPCHVFTFVISSFEFTIELNTTNGGNCRDIFIVCELCGYPGAISRIKLWVTLIKHSIRCSNIFNQSECYNSTDIGSIWFNSLLASKKLFRFSLVHNNLVGWRWLVLYKSRLVGKFRSVAFNFAWFYLQCSYE